jgi:hypothetical protein
MLGLLHAPTVASASTSECPRSHDRDLMKYLSGDRFLR